VVTCPICLINTCQEGETGCSDSKFVFKANNGVTACYVQVVCAPLLPEVSGGYEEKELA
jgi:hypothetical protein